MIAISALVKTLPGTPPRRIFDRLALDVAAGECIAVVGESGVGKSTLLNCIAGLEDIDAGSITIAGERVDTLNDDGRARLRRKHLGFVFQAFHVLPHLRLADNVAVPLWLQGRSAVTADTAAREMLERVGLGNRADDWPRTLSGGELQRVAIARALVHRPRVVLADEPTGNLDPARASEVLDLLLERIRAADAAGILVTHSRSAAQRADRVLQLGPDGLTDITDSLRP